MFSSCWEEVLNLNRGPVNMPFRRSFFLSDPVRPVGGIEDVDGVDDSRPSVLYAPTGP